MTSDENPTDVIEQAAKVLRAYLSTPTAIHAARALHDAGLLADPADRDDAAEDLVSVKVEVPLLRARLKRVEAERDQLRRWKAEAIPVMLGLQDLGKALGVRLGTRITGEAAAERARALKAERDHAKEALALAEKDRRTYHRDALRAEVTELRQKVEQLRLIANVNGDWNDALHRPLPPKEITETNQGFAFHCTCGLTTVGYRSRSSAYRAASKHRNHCTGGDVGLPVPDDPRARPGRRCVVSLKTLRERLCDEQGDFLPTDVDRKITELIDLIDLHRPLGTDGKHGDWHTPTCGCDKGGA